MPDVNGWQTAEGRRQLARLADVLIPGDGELPSASAAAVPTEWVDRVLETRPDLAPDVMRCLSETVTSGGEEGIEFLSVHDADGLRVLKYVIAGGYLMNPHVREILKYPGPGANPASPGEMDFDLRGDILAPVRARGPMYRNTDS